MRDVTAVSPPLLQSSKRNYAGRIKVIHSAPLELHLTVKIWLRQRDSSGYRHYTKERNLCLAISVKRRICCDALTFLPGRSSMPSKTRRTLAKTLGHREDYGLVISRLRPYLLPSLFPLDTGLDRSLVGYSAE